jgi:hypothetical protein
MKHVLKQAERIKLIGDSAIVISCILTEKKGAEGDIVWQS